MRGEIRCCAFGWQKNDVYQVRTAFISFDMWVYYKKTKIRVPQIRTDNFRTFFVLLETLMYSELPVGALVHIRPGLVFPSVELVSYLPPHGMGASLF